ncbi:hypothetical protein KFK09_022717 [Dendrobium nobile]|uniref:Uncharacterized protein n=1 Tax=Dendrobium nobile TaxID=94219 RepID=A0A8T3AK84_DENNO|nr:hypothetical protein KFK09_022717 [Dendrobium nobile]
MAGGCLAKEELSFFLQVAAWEKISYVRGGLRHENGGNHMEVESRNAGLLLCLSVPSTRNSRTALSLALSF